MYHGRILLSAIALSMSACVTLGSQPERYAARVDARVARSVADCRTLFRRTAGDPDRGLNTGDISLVSWNVKKESGPFLAEDLQAIAAGKEIVILQEAVLDSHLEGQLGGLQHKSYSQGFSTRSRATGVATYSVQEPLGECRLTVVEPLLRTPKAISIAEFSLSGRNETLVVANVHAVNFSLGRARFREQMNQIRQVLSVHDGPAILSGDFNTWNRKRMEIVTGMANDLGFSPVPIHADYRTTFNGYALDHVFVRGLTVDASETKRVTSSDHNPISVKLSL